MENLVYIALFAPFASSLFAALFGMSERQIFVGVCCFSTFGNGISLITVFSHSSLYNGRSNSCNYDGLD